MADEAEQSVPAEAAPTAEAPAQVETSAAPETPAEPTPEPIATDQTTATPVEATAPSAEPPPEVLASEVAEPIVSEPIPIELRTEPVATPTQSSPPTPAQQPRTTLLSPNDLALRGLAARRARREARLQKILELVKKEGSIGSLDVQKYLHVSDSTATRYLKELVAQGKLKRVGSPSHARYEIAG